MSWKRGWWRLGADSDPRDPCLKAEASFYGVFGEMAL